MSGPNELNFIRPGKPIENAYAESFIGRLRDECLNENWFISLKDARDIIESWRIDYNANASPIKWQQQMNDIVSDPAIADKLRQECGVVDWRTLKPHYERGALIIVREGLDIITAGVQIAVDNTATVSQWINEQTLIKPTAAQADDWEQRNLSFRSVVVAPFVLIQMVSH